MLLYCVSTYIVLRPLLMQLESGMSMRRNEPPNGTAGSARVAVSGHSSLPGPPPRIMASLLWWGGGCCGVNGGNCVCLKMHRRGAVNGRVCSTRKREAAAAAGERPRPHDARLTIPSRL